VRARTLIAIVGLAVGAATTVQAEEGTVTFHDPSCGFFILKLPGEEGYGLFEWLSGPTPAVGQVMDGDIIASEEIDVTNKTAGGTNRVTHWANAPKEETLVRSLPTKCASKWKRRR
jgi:hypothetical protein